jgi:sugar-phosphatase
MTTGLGSDESVDFWYQYKPWKNRSLEDVKEETFLHVMEQIEENGTLNSGVLHLLNLFENKGMKIGLASSSPLKIIELVVSKFDIANRFQVLCTADQVSFGKPHPAVYLAALNEIGSKNVNSIAFEDSFNGLLSAKSARMKAVAILEPYYYQQTRFDFADLKLRSLDEFTESHLAILNSRKS